MFVSRCHSEVADDANLFCSAVLYLNNSPVLDRTFKILHSVNCSLPHPRCIHIHLKKVHGVILIVGKTWQMWRPGPAADVAEQSTGSSEPPPSRRWSVPRFCAKQHRSKKGMPRHVDTVCVLNKGYLWKKTVTTATTVLHSLSSSFVACSRWWPKYRSHLVARWDPTRECSHFLTWKVKRYWAISSQYLISSCIWKMQQEPRNWNKTTCVCEAEDRGW